MFSNNLWPYLLLYFLPCSKQRQSCVSEWWHWYTAWAIPGLGMFSEAYIIFSLGLTKPLQTAMFPTCFGTHDDCKEHITHVQNYIQIVGIIVGR
jgi:hypothetical protein